MPLKRLRFLSEDAAVRRVRGTGHAGRRGSSLFTRSAVAPYSNVQLPGDFRADLSRFFKIERSFAGSHNWNHSQPNRKLMAAVQAHLNIKIPVLSPILAVDYLYICSPRG